MEDLESDILVADLGRHHIPITTEEVGLKEHEDNATWLRMMREEFAGLKAWLSGPDGQHGGILQEIKDDLAGLDTGQRQIEGQITTLVNVQIRDKAELDAKILSVKNDVDNVGVIARSANETISDHVDEMKSMKKFKIEQTVAVLGVVAGVAGVVAGIIIARVPA